MGNTFNSFLAELAKAGFEIEIRKNADKILAMQEAVRWEKRKQLLRSNLSILLETTDLDRKEMIHVMTDINTAGPDELIEKINFVQGRVAEPRDPAKQFVSRIKSRNNIWKTKN